jgi:hypothetical protein
LQEPTGVGAFPVRASYARPTATRPRTGADFLTLVAALVTTVACAPAVADVEVTIAAARLAEALAPTANAGRAVITQTTDNMTTTARADQLFHPRAHIVARRGNALLLIRGSPRLDGPWPSSVATLLGHTDHRRGVSAGLTRKPAKQKLSIALVKRR